MQGIKLTEIHLSAAALDAHKTKQKTRSIERVFFCVAGAQEGIAIDFITA